MLPSCRAAAATAGLIAEDACGKPLLDRGKLEMRGTVAAAELLSTAGGASSGSDGLGPSSARARERK